MKGKCFSGNPPNTYREDFLLFFRRNRNTGKLQGVKKGVISPPGSSLQRTRDFFFEGFFKRTAHIRTIACWKEKAIASMALPSDSCTISYS